MAFDFDSLPDDAKRAAFAKMKPGKGEQPPADDSDIEANLERIIRSFAEDGDPIHEGEIRAIRQELERQQKIEGFTRAKNEALAELTGGPKLDKANQPGDSSSEAEVQGEITLTHTPDPPWVEKAFRDVFGDPTKELQDYLDRVNAEREARKRDLEAALTEPVFRLEGDLTPLSRLNPLPFRFQKAMPLELLGLMPSLQGERPPWLDYWSPQPEYPIDRELRRLEQKLRALKTLSGFELDADLNVGERSFEIKGKKDIDFGKVETEIDRLMRKLWRTR